MAADDIFQPDDTVQGILPETNPPDPFDDQAFDQPFDELPETEDIEVDDEPDQPLGRSWAFDFTKPGFQTVGGGRGPLETRGIETLRFWIEKCLRTSAGSSPIHPDEYGIQDLTEFYGMPLTQVPQGEIEDRITEALTFHPRITDVVDFDWDFDDDEEWMDVSFAVVIDNENDQFQIPVEDFPVLG